MLSWHAQEQLYVYVILIFMFLDTRCEDKRTWTEW